MLNPFYALLTALGLFHSCGQLAVSPEEGGAERMTRGAWGEEQAMRWLQRHRGMRLIARNWRDGREEIDLVMMDRTLLVFVEVRTRHRESRFTPIETVNRRKRRAQRRACLAFLRSRRLFAQSWRFDVIGVRYDDHGLTAIEHFPNVRISRS